MAANGSKPNASRLGVAQPARRNRRSPKLPTTGPVRLPYALSHPDLKGITPAHVTRMVLDSEAWKQLMKPVLDQLDKDRTVPGKESPLYTSEELESVLYFQRMSGVSSCKRARNELAGDREGARVILGFDKPRNAGRRVVKLRDGVPSEATISRHRARLPEWRREELYDAVERRVLEEHLEFPELLEEARELGLDGTKIATHYTAPIREKNTGRVVNDARVTAPDAGYVPWSASQDHCGHGWNLISITTATGIPLARRVVPLQAPETDVALDLVNNEFAEVVAPRLLAHMNPEHLAVLSADGGFNKPELRTALRRHGIIENIHPVSHADEPTSRANAAKQNARRIPIQGYKDWLTNGHRELVCVCGAGTSMRRLSRNRHGHVVARNEGKCANCGSITITSGDWRLAQNPSRWVRINPRNQNEKPDPLMGNPFTYNDLVANDLGRRRFAHNEGFHGQLQSRFALIKDKRWFRRKAEAEIATSMVFIAMHVVAMYQRRLAQGGPVIAFGSTLPGAKPGVQASPGLAA